MARKMRLDLNMKQSMFVTGFAIKQSTFFGVRVKG